MIDNDTLSNIQTLSDQLYSESEVDYVGFWEIVAQVRKLFLYKDDQDKKIIAITISSRLIDMGLVAFNFKRNSDGSFSILLWADQNMEAVATRIAREWGALSTDPNPGDICWFKKRDHMPVS